MCQQKLPYRFMPEILPAGLQKTVISFYIYICSCFFNQKIVESTAMYETVLLVVISRVFSVGTTFNHNIFWGYVDFGLAQSQSFWPRVAPLSIITPDQECPTESCVRQVAEPIGHRRRLSQQCTEPISSVSYIPCLSLSRISSIQQKYIRDKLVIIHLRSISGVIHYNILMPKWRVYLSTAVPTCN